MAPFEYSMWVKYIERYPSTRQEVQRLQMLVGQIYCLLINVWSSDDKEPITLENVAPWLYIKSIQEQEDEAKAKENMTRDNTLALMRQLCQT